MDSNGAVEGSAGPENAERRGSDVVLGLGDLDATAAAGAWAAREADRRGTRLRIVHALAPVVPVGDTAFGWYSLEQDDARQAAAQDHLDGFAAKLRAEFPGVEVVTRLVTDRPRAVLCEESRHAALLVTGSRRHGGWHAALHLGSTSLFASAHAVCPVVVVHEPREEPRERRGIVVGHDGSHASDCALEFAAARAAERGEPLTIVRTWMSAIMPLDSWSSSTWQEARDTEGAAQRQDLEGLATRTRTEHPGCRLEVSLLHEDRPVEALLGAASTAELLVVGTRGHGAFMSALLGSTSHGILHRAELPVVVVPDAERVAAARRRHETGAGH